MRGRLPPAVRGSAPDAPKAGEPVTISTRQRIQAVRNGNDRYLLLLGYRDRGGEYKISRRRIGPVGDVNCGAPKSLGRILSRRRRFQRFTLCLRTPRLGPLRHCRRRRQG